MMNLPLLLLLVLQDKPADTLKKSVAAVREHKSMKVNFQATVDVPQSDPIRVNGTALYDRERDLLFIDYHASGGSVKFIVRHGGMAVEYNMLVDEWVDSREMGNPNAGRGLSNPNEVLDQLLANAEAATNAGPRSLTMKLDGEKIKPLIRYILEESEVRWADSKAEIGVELAADSILPAKISSSAKLAWKKDTVSYQGEVTIESFDKEFDYAFQDRQRPNKPRSIALDEAAKKKLGLIPK
jgi:hypothetical protein